jgi:hypothetical protein
MSETIGRLLAAGNVAEVFERGSRVVKLYRSAARNPTVFREAAIHAAVEAMALPVPAVWGVLEVGARSGIVFDRVKERSFAQRMREESEPHTGVPAGTRPAACTHSLSAGPPVRQSEVEAGDKHRRYWVSRRTAQADFAWSPCRHAGR